MPICPAFIVAEQGAAERDDVCAAIPDTETFSTCQRKIWGIPTCSGNAASGRAKGAVYGGTGRFYCTDCWANHNDATDPFHFDDADQQSDDASSIDDARECRHICGGVSFASLIEALIS